jgi:hypothetical protein
MNDVTLMKFMKIANRKSHDLFQFFRGIHGKIIIVPVNERNAVEIWSAVAPARPTRRSHQTTGAIQSPGKELALRDELVNTRRNT